MMRKICGLFFICLLLASATLSAQNLCRHKADVPMTEKYSITVFTVTPDGEMLYLRGFCGHESRLMDSAIVKHGKAVFKSKKQKLPCGDYLLELHDTLHPYPDVIAEVILNKDTKITLNHTHHVDSVTGFLVNDIDIQDSEENELLYSFRNFLMKVYTPDIRKVCREYRDIAPNSFVVKYITAAYATLQTKGDAMLRQAIEDMDFSEPRLLHSPLPVYSLIRSRIASMYEAEQIAAFMDSILALCSNEAMKEYFLQDFYRMMDVHIPIYDPVLVHLYDRYGDGWMDEDRQRINRRKIAQLRKINPGAKIPEITAFDTLGNVYSTNDIRTKYTVLWFWDPDCDHCKAITPQLHDFYRERAGDLDFEVFAVEINDDYDRWKKFSDEHELWDWLNLTTAKGDPAVDVIEYFDIMVTPALVLVDNSTGHTIIARQVTLDVLKFLLEKNR